MKHKGFNRDIIIGTKQFRFTDKDDQNLEFIIGITKKGYHLFMATDNASNIIEKHTNLSLDKLNKLLPDDMQLSKDQIIYVLTADKD